MFNRSKYDGSFQSKRNIKMEKLTIVDTFSKFYSFFRLPFYLLFFTKKFIKKNTKKKFVFPKIIHSKIHALVYLRDNLKTYPL